MQILLVYMSCFFEVTADNMKEIYDLYCENLTIEIWISVNNMISF